MPRVSVIIPTYNWSMLRWRHPFGVVADDAGF